MLCRQSVHSLHSGLGESALVQSYGASLIRQASCSQDICCCVPSCELDCHCLRMLSVQNALELFEGVCWLPCPAACMRDITVHICVRLQLSVGLANRYVLDLQDRSPCAQFIKSLETHVSSLVKTRPEYLMELTFMATLASECCRLTDHSNSTLPDSCSILKALLQVQFNSIAIVPQQHAAASDRVAVAVYPTASLMNHSCIPNVALAFEGSSLTARVTETVQPGTSLLHCYGTFSYGMTCPGCPCLAPATRHCLGISHQQFWVLAQSGYVYTICQHPAAQATDPGRHVHSDNQTESCSTGFLANPPIPDDFLLIIHCAH